MNVEAPDSWGAQKAHFEQTIRPKEMRCQELVGKMDDKVSAGGEERYEWNGTA